MEIMGDYPFTQHWPVASTLFFGYPYKIFRAVVGSNDIAIFMVVIVQMFVCAACFAWCLKAQMKLKISSGFLYSELLLCAVLTIVARYTTALVKDAAYSCLVAAFTAQLAVVLNDQQIEKKTQKFPAVDLAALIVLGIAVCVFRHNGQYIVIICMLYSLYCFAVKRKTLYRALTVSLFAVFLIQFVWTNSLSLAGIPRGSIKEALSIPFQQTARYAVTYPDQVTEDEKDAINAALNYEYISKNYDPKLSDYVKDTYHADSLKELFCYFKKAWLPQFVKHPTVYFEATFNNTIGFFLAISKERSSGVYIGANGSDEHMYFSKNVDMISDIERSMLDFINQSESFFPVLLFCNCAIQIWLAIWLFVRNMHSDRMRLLLIPSFVGILVCVAGPTFTHNGIRYALPIIYSNISLMGMFSSEIQKRLLWEEET